VRIIQILWIRIFSSFVTRVFEDTKLSSDVFHADTCRGTLVRTFCIIKYALRADLGVFSAEQIMPSINKFRELHTSLRLAPIAK